MNALKKFLFSGLLLLLIFLSGCTWAEMPAPTASSTVTLLPTATALPSTATPTTVATATAEPTATVAAAAQQAAPSGDRAAFVSETYPDNSVLEAGESFTKAFELRNAGNVTWTTDYALVRDETTPAGETLGAAERLALPQAVGPGETLTLELPLTAPEDPGTYTVYWTLRDAAGAVVPVDGVQRVWATIRVCAEGQDCSVAIVAAGGASAYEHEITMSFVEVTHEEGKIHIEYCVTVANPDFLQYQPKNAIVIIDGEEIIINEGGFARAVYDPIPGYNCFEGRPPVTSETFNQAQSVILRVGKVEALVPHPISERCEAIKPGLLAKYPGMVIECDPSEHNPYRSLIPPAGLTQDEAHQIFLDTLSAAVYGTWEMIIK